MRNRILSGPWTDFQVRAEFHALNALGPSVIASATNGGVGDDIGQDTAGDLAFTEDEMSHAAIASVLAREDLSTAERLVAFSLASFANSDQIAWPSTALAAARARLATGRYLQARAVLARRGLIVIQGHGRGRSRSDTVSLGFARCGPWWDGGVNAQLVEAVLGRSRACGSARLLVVALAALADDEGTVEGLSTAEVRGAAGLSDTTYRRARAALLASGRREDRDPDRRGLAAADNQLGCAHRDRVGTDPRRRINPGRQPPARSARVDGRRQPGDDHRRAKRDTRVRDAPVADPDRD
jgi:hypothetical protein